jgi:hypothetical protein
MRLFESSAVIWGIWIVCLSIVAGGVAANGQHATAKRAASTQGTLSGHVFAITAGGDLKPARMARVYILFYDMPILDTEDTADVIYENAHLKAQDQYIKDLDAYAITNQWTEKETCMRDLDTFQPAMSKAWIGRKPTISSPRFS